MKTIFLICFISLAGLLFSNLAFAQQQKGNSNLAAGLGFASTEMFYDFGDDMVRVLAVVGTLGYYNASIINRSYSPTFHLNYYKAKSNELSIGLGAAYEKATGDYQQNNQIVGNFVRHSYTLAAEGKYLYLNRRIISLYGVLGFGFTLNKQETQKPADWTDFFVKKQHLNWHINPIGIQVGKKVAGFAEYGFGYKGTLNAGINYRF